MSDTPDPQADGTVTDISSRRAAEALIVDVDGFEGPLDLLLMLSRTSAWSELSERFDDYMAPKSRVIETAELGGQTVYRLQAYGFDGLSDARSFCAVLLAESADCIPALTR